MADWATQNRLYPPGYHTTDTRYRRTSIDSSLPFSIASNKRHSCRIKTKQLKKFNENEVLTDSLRHGLSQAFHFYDSISAENNDDRNPKLLATYASNLNWPRSVCCLSGSDGSLIVCEQDRCRLLLFTSQLMLRSTCGGKKGNDLYEFDSPWSVASFIDGSSSKVLVADTNNRRVQCFSIGFHGEFMYKHTFVTKEKPYFVGTSNQHFAISCEKSLILTFSIKKRKQLATIDLNRTSIQPNSSQIALPFCMDSENSFLFFSNSTSSISMIHQLTITGEYLRSIKLDHYPFLRISSLTFDNYDQQLIIVDSFNSVIYSVEHDLDEDNVIVLLKHSDSLNTPQALCIGNEGHLIVVECSVTTQHTLKIFRYHPCSCHSRVTTSSVKTSETTSVRSFIFPY
ncbi:unnamed protein product [Rotaria magnacalcarata]|uniref:Uncharacterized protein n=3 Tax=Rotaria magnacalcarata TaxID=392030 RepID=A0A816UJD3_9BILA|nr:unnamed protein product [Rotaria magnacalcarata]CAF1615779.1 unnamed protein product [Rotaria magnacalcarata]CAF2108751.1 unnamed protein product [Rotaria magnacalcarata]CAF2117412.1 unnamed protein product [Rotaria magnacalcarata]CAF2123102.1 unnamed protein product [Rotaria magnacalcarata]